MENVKLQNLKVHRIHTFDISQAKGKEVMESFNKAEGVGK